MNSLSKRISRFKMKRTASEWNVSSYNTERKRCKKRWAKPMLTIESECAVGNEIIHTQKKKNNTMKTERKHSNELAKAKRWRVSATMTWYKDTLPMASQFIIYSLRPVSIVMLLVLNPLVTTMFLHFIRNYSLYTNNHPNSDKYSMLLCQQRQITTTPLLETNCKFLSIYHIHLIFNLRAGAPIFNMICAITYSYFSGT